MQNGQAEPPIYKLLRWFVALALTLFGSWFYIAAPMIGSGLHLDPMPGMGMIIAGMALFGLIAGYLAVRTEKKANHLANLIEIVFGIGAISLLIGVVQWGTNRFIQCKPPKPATRGRVRCSFGSAMEAFQL